MSDKDAWYNLSRSCQDDIMATAGKLARCMVRVEAASNYGYGQNTEASIRETEEAMTHFLTAIESACKTAYGKK